MDIEEILRLLRVGEATQEQYMQLPESRELGVAIFVLVAGELMLFRMSRDLSKTDYDVWSVPEGGYLRGNLGSKMWQYAIETLYRDAGILVEGRQLHLLGYVEMVHWEEMARSQMVCYAVSFHERPARVRMGAGALEVGYFSLNNPPPLQHPWILDMIDRVRKYTG